MATLDNLPEMIAQDPRVREDFISTLASFCERHGIDAAPEDFVGLEPGIEADTKGQLLEQPALGMIYRDGPNYSRWIWT